jgi:exopolysaccharide biosynthesis protein
MIGWRSLALVGFFLPVAAYADWTISERRDFSSNALNVSEVRVADGAASAEVQLVYCSADKVRFQVVPNIDGRISGVREAVDRVRGIAGINGGYFQPDLEPDGLLISEGAIVHPIVHAKLLSGVFLQTHGRPELKRVQELAGAKGLEEAIQCGPFLVDNRRAAPGLNRDRVAARTFVFTCPSGIWGVGICRSVTLAELSRILIDPKLIPGHPIIRALNFDGGSSTALYVPLQNRELISEERQIVGNYLVLRAVEGS